MSNPKRGGHPKFYELGEEENKLYSAKHYQYATDADPMSNFRLCGDLIRKMLKPGMDPTIAAALCLMSKQVVGVYEIVGEGKTGTVESLEDKLKDIGIYSRILRILVAEAGQKVTDGPYCDRCEKLAEFRLEDPCGVPGICYFCYACAEARPLEEIERMTAMDKL